MAALKCTSGEKFGTVPLANRPTSSKHIKNDKFIHMISKHPSKRISIPVYINIYFIYLRTRINIKHSNARIQFGFHSPEPVPPAHRRIHFLQSICFAPDLCQRKKKKKKKTEKERNAKRRRLLRFDVGTFSFCDFVWCELIHMSVAYE